MPGWNRVRSVVQLGGVHVVRTAVIDVTNRPSGRVVNVHVLAAGRLRPVMSPLSAQSRQRQETLLSNAHNAGANANSSP